MAAEGDHKHTHEEWLGSIMKAKSPPYSNARIHKVPMILKEDKNHDKYYVPKVVSLGPYHHGEPNLKLFEDFKHHFTNKLVKDNQELVRSLYNHLAEIVQVLRGNYEDDTRRFSDEEFTRMMLLDGCFILYFIQQPFLEYETDYLGLKRHQVMYVRQDMFLLENQIPYLVLTELMKLVPDEMWEFKIKRFVDDNNFANNILVKERRNKRNHQKLANTSHLLELLQTRLTIEKVLGARPNDVYTLRNASELKDMGIAFNGIRALGSLIPNTVTGIEQTPTGNYDGGGIR